MLDQVRSYSYLPPQRIRTGNVIGCMQCGIFWQNACVNSMKLRNRIKVCYLCMEFPSSLFDTVPASATTTVGPVTLWTSDQ